MFQVSQLLYLLLFNFWLSALLCKIAALRSFSHDKIHYWRESASGMSSMAYFLSKDTTDLFNVVLKPILYLSMFYYFNNPRSSLLDNYIVLLCLVYCVTGIAYILAIVFEPGPAQLVSVPTIMTNYFVLHIHKPVHLIFVANISNCLCHV